MRVLILAMLAWLIAGCVPLPPAAPAPAPTVAVAPVVRPAAVEYDLGEATVVQANFPDDSRFHNMPVRLNGVIAVPNEGDGPFPVIVILHGTHPGCPEIDHVDRWPCDPALEQPNYRGFAYLAEQLAANGYVALSININAENTFGFGEPLAGERLTQIVDAHLRALAAASAGGEHKFGVDLGGKADLQRLGFVGHSRGGDQALLLMTGNTMAAAAATPGGYGPVGGILMVAPSPGFTDPAQGSPVPLGIILPLCDGDVTDQEGQHFYEGARLARGQTAWANSVFLERANHNGFNTTLGADPFGTPGRPDCTSLLDPQTQQTFLTQYADAFFDTIFDGATAGEQGLRWLGISPALPAPTQVGGLEARVATLYPAAGRTALFAPAVDGELTTNRLGGAVQTQGVSAFFCDAGSYTPLTRPGTEPCRRATVVVPGQPALAVVSWDSAGAGQRVAAWRFAIPQGKGDLHQAVAVSLRAAVDPLSERNARGQSQSFAVQMTDGAGKTARVAVGPDEPALRYPAGELLADATFGGLFTGRVPLTTIRIPLSAFASLDLADIREVALVFDQTPSGTLFLADLEWVRTEK